MDWAPDERVLSGVEKLTDSDIASYASRHGFDPSGEVELLRDLGLSAADRLVEFGSGPGAFALAVAQVAAEVIAVDPAPAMCRYLSQRVLEADVRNVTVINSGFLTYGHEGAPVGFVFSRNALHHLPDFWKAQALLRIHDILEPGGVLRLRDLVYSFPPDQAQGALTTWIDSAGESPKSSWSGKALIDHIRSEFSTYTWLLEPMLASTGFESVDRFHSDSGVFAHYTCRRP